MGMMEDLVKEVVGEFAGMTELIVDEISGDSDELLLRRFRQQYDNIPTEAVVAIRDNFGHEEGETNPCQVCKIVADEEFKRAEEFS